MLFFEIGLTGIFWNENLAENSTRKPNIEYYLAPLIGYRLNYKRIVFKAQFTPIISWSKAPKVSEHFTSYFGLSVGYSF
ncbi:MAG: hypothetical protein V3V14_02340 [Saprospiraceae bacterium]